MPVKHISVAFSNAAMTKLETRPNILFARPPTPTRHSTYLFTSELQDISFWCEKISTLLWLYEYSLFLNINLEYQNKIPEMLKLSNWNIKTNFCSDYMHVFSIAILCAPKKECKSISRIWFFYVTSNRRIGI